MDSTAIERVARALADRAGDIRDPLGGNWKGFARDAIEALRDLSDEMAAAWLAERDMTSKRSARRGQAVA